jgi:hypothetical protein
MYLSIEDYATVTALESCYRSQLWRDWSNCSPVSSTACRI